MDYLIKLIARALAGRIQRGQTTGAIAGALLGTIIAMIAAHLIVTASLIGRDYAVASHLILSIPLAILGALLGSAAGPRKAAADVRKGVRITQYNRAAGLLAIALMFLALLIASFVLKDAKPDSDPTPALQKWGIGIGIGLVFVIVAFLASREIWHVDLGPVIFIRRLIGSRSYSRHELKVWGFEIRPNEVVQQTFSGTLKCCLQFNDGYICRVEARGEDSQPIIDILGSQAEQ